MTIAIEPTPVYLLVVLITVIGVGLPIGFLLKRRLLDNITLLLLVALVGGVALDLIIYNQLIIWCYRPHSPLAPSAPINVTLTGILFTIPIGILGAIFIIEYITKRWN